MNAIDLNADLGEADTPAGQQAEADILRYISSANIACGGHAGNVDTMRRTVRAAKANGVAIGAHPSYPDRENFGRKTQTLGADISAKSLRKSLTEQIVTLAEIASAEGASIAFVKPHGALYNDAAVNPDLAALIVGVVAGLDSRLKFVGSPGSALESEAKKAGLGFIGEGFIDRRYEPTGRLQNRAIKGAVITDQAARMVQIKSLITDRTVMAANGASITVLADTLCLHGDSAGAVETAKQARKAIESAGVTIKAFTHVH